MSTAQSLTETVALNADIVGYSALVADDLDATTTTVDEYRRLVDRVISDHGGRLVDFVGDNFMGVFTDAKDAVASAIAITREIEDRNVDIPAPRRVRFRMGIDLGDIVSMGGNYHGDALNIAARIQAMAPAGGVSVSGRVYQALDEPALRFRPMGRHRLKNIPEEVEVYELADLPTDRDAATVGAALSLAKPSLAVLPIHTEFAEERLQGAATVIRHDLLHRLAQVPQLEVLDAGVDPTRQVETRARYMLESGAHQFGDQVRVYTELFDVTTMNVVKAQKWIVDIDDLVSRSEAIAEDVARVVEVELIVGAPAGLYAELDDPEAIQNVYLGWYQLTIGSPEGWARSIEFFGAVARSHPDLPFGHALSAYANLMAVNNGWTTEPGTTLDLAREQAGRALGVGDTTGLAQAVVAAILMTEGKADEALAATSEIQKIRPTCDVTYGLEASVRRYLGQWEQASGLADVAMRLTGVNKPWYPTVKACSLFMGNRLEQAASIAESVLEFQPDNLEASLVLVAAQVEQGLERRARATADMIRERFPSVDLTEWLDRNPYQHPEVVKRWKEDLAAVDLVESA